MPRSSGRDSSIVPTALPMCRAMAITAAHASTAAENDAIVEGDSRIVARSEAVDAIWNPLPLSPPKRCTPGSGRGVRFRREAGHGTARDLAGARQLLRGLQLRRDLPVSQ